MHATLTYSPLTPRTFTKCPHTYGVRICPFGSFATDPCRPTACIPAAPFRHTPCRFRPRRTANVWRNLPQHPRSGETYTFSAKEKDSETGLSYFGARYYSSDLSIWLSVDPMSDKYPSLSPYVYCANNPVKLVDPDGRKIVFAKGTSKEFKEQFAAAIKKLNEHHLGGIASALEKSKIKYTIAETTEQNGGFNSLTQTISWNPTMGLEVDDGAILSPTTVLNHEFAHAITYDAAVKEGKLKEWYADCAKGSDPDYGSKNEKWVITRTEQKTAKALGEISKGQVTRKKHNGTPVTTENSTSNKKNVNQNDEKM